MGMWQTIFRSGRVPGKAEPVLCDERQQAVDLLHGKHYNDCLLGRVFSQTCTPLGLAFPIYTATALGSSAITGLPIWNPPQSGVNVELIRHDVGWVSGTAGIGSVGLIVRRCNAILSGEVCSALANTTPINGVALYGGNASRTLSSNAGTVTVTAGGVGDWVRTLFSINLENSTTTPLGTTCSTYDYDGTVILSPGTFSYLACTVASVALYSQTVVWKEIPLNT